MKATIKYSKSTAHYLAVDLEVQCKVEQLWWQKQGLSFTASGYGNRIPTQYMVKVDNRWRRVYCVIFSNIGTLYIGPSSAKILVDIEL